MKSYFPDINVWLAAAYRAHQHHVRASSWFAAVQDARVGFCRMTQLGFLRLLTHPAVMQNEVMSASEAWNAYDRFAADDRVTFFDEPDRDQLEGAFRALTGARRFSHQQWPDAYLAAFAKAGAVTLVTFDHGLRRLAGADAQLLR